MRSLKWRHYPCSSLVTAILLSFVSIMATTKEDLSKLKLGELQKELEARSLDTSGKKSDLVDRLWAAVQKPESTPSAEKVSPKLSPGASCEGNDAPDPKLLLVKLRILKEKQSVEQERIGVKARAEQDELRLEARSEQLTLELQLAEMGHFDESALEPLRIRPPTSTPETESAPESILSSHVKRVLLPPTELRPFTGEVEDFHLFWRAFETRIMTKTEDQAELLFYLDQFTRDKPNQLVRSCLHLKEGGFAEAKRLLEVRYGDPIYLVDSYAKRVKAWPRVAPGDVEALDKLVLFLTEVKNAMSAIHLGEFEHPSTMRLIISKVPSYLQDRWLREADRITQEGRTVRFTDMVRFLTIEIRVKRSPLFGARPGGGGH